MGRVKLKIKKLESTSNRQVTYSKRRSGIVKKAKELAILCDIDIVLLMFSPTGKPSLYLGEHSNVDEVITKFAQLTPQERAKRKLESLEALKKTFKKLDHDINLQDFLGAGTRSVEELGSQMRVLQAELAEVHKRFSCWTNPDKIDSIELLTHMEDSLQESLDQIRVQKENFEKHQFLPLDCSSQFQTGMHLPLLMGGTQDNSLQPWIPNNENQYMILPDDANFISHRDLECSRDASFPSCSDIFGTGKTDIGNMEQADSTRRGDASFNELDSAKCLRLQLNEQYHYPPYGNLNFPEAKNLKTDAEVNFHGNPLDYQINNNFEIPRHPIYNNAHHSWLPASGSYSISMFNESSYPQPNQL